MDNQIVTLLGSAFVCLCVSTPIVLVVSIGILIKANDAKQKKKHINDYIEKENYDKYFNQ
jgi:hypothetical protein